LSLAGAQLYGFAFVINFVINYVHLLKVTHQYVDAVEVKSLFDLESAFD
jgi:hypothetical protein